LEQRIKRKLFVFAYFFDEVGECSSELCQSSSKANDSQRHFAYDQVLYIFYLQFSLESKLLVAIIGIELQKAALLRGYNSKPIIIIFQQKLRVMQ
jgi:hypothetical protein